MRRNNNKSIIEMQGYKYTVDGDTGQELAVDESTGDTGESVDIRTPKGSLIFTPKQQREYRERKEQERLNTLRRTSKPKYVFVSSDKRFEGVTPETVTRLVYLSTFVRYRGGYTHDKDGQLMLSERVPMRRMDLAKVLKLSDATVSRFLKEVCPDYITVRKDTTLYMNTEIFVRGDIKHLYGHTKYTQVFIEAVRKLYLDVDKSKHKHLGYLFDLLPYVNIEYNLLCYDPTEQDIDKIELLTLSDFCEKVGYETSNIRRLLAEYRNIRFNVHGRMERFCSIVCDGSGIENAKICINPHILHSGSECAKVEILGAFFKD